MSECLFCDMVKGDVPATKVYEDDDFLVIQDIQQNTKGHSLLIPKTHSKDILEMDKSLGCRAFTIIQKIGNAMMQGLGAKGFNVIINTKPEAGQVIFHTHIHIIPRYGTDKYKFWPHIDTTEADRVGFAAKIITALDD